MAIKHWPADDRPREKLLTKGPASLSDAELLAIFLRTGVRGKSAVEVARELLARFGSINALAAASVAELRGQHGIGQAKAAQLKAGLELAQRALGEQIEAGSVLGSPRAVRDFLRLKFHGLPHEMFVAIYLDAQNRVVAVDELFRGTLTQTSVYPREVVKHALRHNAAGVIFAHNHPSGVAEPSQADELLTSALKQALGTVEVRVLDHFVVGAVGVMSFAERGLL